MPSPPPPINDFGPPRRRHVIIAAAVVYGLAGIVAFGHAAAARSAEEGRDYAECRADPKRVCFYQREPAVAVGFSAGLLWPLYLSWEIFE